jgi:hypothetical protein
MLEQRPHALLSFLSFYFIPTLSIELNIQGSTFRMKYDGYTMRSLSNSVHKKGKKKYIYKLQIVNIGAIKENEPGAAADWAAGAAKQPLVPAQLPRDVPTHWLMEISGIENWLRLHSAQCTTLLDQIGHRYEDHVDVL